jgi:hypothetical protein
MGNRHTRGLKPVIAVAAAITVAVAVFQLPDSFFPAGPMWGLGAGEAGSYAEPIAIPQGEPTPLGLAAPESGYIQLPSVGLSLPGGEGVSVSGQPEGPITASYGDKKFTIVAARTPAGGEGAPSDSARDALVDAINQSRAAYGGSTYIRDAADSAEGEWEAHDGWEARRLAPSLHSGARRSVQGAAETDILVYRDSVPYAVSCVYAEGDEAAEDALFDLASRMAPSAAREEGSYTQAKGGAKIPKGFAPLTLAAGTMYQDPRTGSPYAGITIAVLGSEVNGENIRGAYALVAGSPAGMSSVSLSEGKAVLSLQDGTKLMAAGGKHGNVCILYPKWQERTALEIADRF